MSNDLPAHTVQLFVLTRELTFSSRIREATTALGMSMKVVRTVSSLRAAITECGTFNRAVIDLSTIQTTELPELKLISESPSTQTIAVGAHVQRELLEAVKATGSIAVYTRSEFVVHLPRLLQEPFAAHA